MTTKLELTQLRKIIREKVEEVLAGGKRGPADGVAHDAQVALLYYAYTGDEASRKTVEGGFRKAGMPTELLQQVMLLADEFRDAAELNGQYSPITNRARLAVNRPINAWIKKSGFTLYR